MKKIFGFYANEHGNSTVIKERSIATQIPVLFLPSGPRPAGGGMHVRSVRHACDARTGPFFAPRCFCSALALANSTRQPTTFQGPTTRNAALVVVGTECSSQSICFVCSSYELRTNIHNSYIRYIYSCLSIHSFIRFYRKNDFYFCALE